MAPQASGGWQDTGADDDVAAAVPHACSPGRGTAAPTGRTQRGGAESRDSPSPGRPCHTRPGCSTAGSAGGASPSPCPRRTAHRAGVNGPSRPPRAPAASPPPRPLTFPTPHLGQQLGQHLHKVSAHAGTLTPAAGPVHLPGGLWAERAWPEPTADPCESRGGPGTGRHGPRSHPGSAAPTSQV